MDVNLYHEDDITSGHCTETNIYANNNDIIALYFYDTFNMDEIYEVSKAYDHGAKVYAISSYKNHESNYNSIIANKDNINMDAINFAYDTENHLQLKHLLKKKHILIIYGQIRRIMLSTLQQEI